MAQQGPRKTRQRSTAVMGWIGTIGGVLVATALTFDTRNHAVALVSLAIAALSWCTLARPYLQVDSDALIVSNVLREVRLPWEGISHAKSRGSLQIIDNDEHKTTVWAIGSQKAGRRFGGDGGGRPSWRPAPGELAELPTSSRAVAEGINAETVDNPTDTPSGRSIRWLPVPCAATAAAVLCIALAALG